jgi:hypothetical protein
MGVVGQERIPNATESAVAGTVLVAGLSYRFPGDVLPSAERAFLAASLTKIPESDCCRVCACPTIVMRFR